MCSLGVCQTFWRGCPSLDPLVRLKSKVQYGRSSYMKTYGISTRYSTITIELSFYVFLYLYNCNVMINCSEKMQKKHGRSTWDYLRGFIPPEGVFLLHFSTCNNFWLEFKLTQFQMSLVAMVKKKQDGRCGFNTYFQHNYITKYYIFSSENNFTLKCNVKPNVL